LFFAQKKYIYGPLQIFIRTSGPTNLQHTSSSVSYVWASSSWGSAASSVSYCVLQAIRATFSLWSKVWCLCIRWGTSLIFF